MKEGYKIPILKKANVELEFYYWEECQQFVRDFRVQCDKFLLNTHRRADFALIGKREARLLKVCYIHNKESFGYAPKEREKVGEEFAVFFGVKMFVDITIESQLQVFSKVCITDLI